MSLFLRPLVSFGVLISATLWAQPREGLIAHWPLAGDVRDYSGNGRHGENHGADLRAAGPDGKPGSAAAFNGRDAWIRIPGPEIPLGAKDFTLAVRIHTARESDDLPGDILSQYDAATRRGVNFGLLSLPGCLGSQPNDRNVHFGIDQARVEPWLDHGRPGQAIYVMALAVYDGALYAGTCEELGRVYRFEGERGWVDCGAPDRANAITSMVVLDGQLYVGSGKYRLSGSAMKDTRNQTAGGSVFRYLGGERWEHCGRVSPETETIGGLGVFRGKLHATSAYRPAGMFRHEGGDRWTPLGSVDGRRSEAIGVHNGSLFTTVWDGGGVFGFDGARWSNFGNVPETTQTYGFVVHRGELHVTTWPKGKVFRWGGTDTWHDVGRLGDEAEVMGAAHYNGKLYAGTLPLAKVFRYEEDTAWTDMGRLDFTPEVVYRRVWAMAVFNGRLFAGTLPDGKVHSMAAGRVATVDRSLTPGWHHLAAVRRGGRLEVYVDGVKAAESAAFAAADYDLTCGQSLRIGVGEHDFFHGRLADLRIYDRALAAEEIKPWSQTR
ncbi:MAG: hypothetical protein RIQ93_2806 [Verrucomicrobiota bacterium]|jgi:hypothetical protein